MPLPTVESARDEIFGLFKTGWDAGTSPLNAGTPYEIKWQGVDNGVLPAVGIPYAVAFVHHSLRSQSTLGEPGNRRFTQKGTITIQVFDALSVKQGLSNGLNLAIIARDCFEGKGTASGIIFRNAAIKEIGRHGEWYQFQVFIDFEYDEVK